jgi:uncharacterized protein (AIM24 family)
VVDDEPSPPSAEFAGEDFLFHLYRGSELLQDNRVHEAKQELEHALGLQPRDPKGQDLLAIVYFRLGLYPRAISIYRELIGAYGQATTPRINLALCYLKTGQPAAARVELEKVIERDPSHARAWGYLGLAFQRLGDQERAIHAFQAGGHHQMAKRLADLSAQSSAARSLTSPEREAVSRAATDAFDELDRKDFQSLRPDASGERTSSAGTWAAVEPGRESYGVAERRSLPSIVLPSDSLVPPAARAPSMVPAVSQSIAPAPPLPRESTPPELAPPAVPLAAFLREPLLVFPRGVATLHPSGSVLFQTGTAELNGGDIWLAVRMDAVRAMSGQSGLATRAIPRRVRGREIDEPLGGTASPLVRLDGATQVVLSPGPGTKLHPILLGDEPLFVRESALIALDGEVIYENGRLPTGEGDSSPIVQLRGPGTITLALPAGFLTMEVVPARAVVARGHGLLGWTGSVVPRSIAPTEAPNRARGLVSLTGEGMVLLDGR